MPEPQSLEESLLAGIPEYDVIISFNFSELIAATGSAVAAVGPLREFARALTPHCSAIYTFQQFFYLSVKEAHERRWVEQVNCCAERLGFGPTVLGACSAVQMPAHGCEPRRLVHPWLGAVLARTVRDRGLWSGESVEAPVNAGEPWSILTAMDVRDQSSLLATPPPLPRARAQGPASIEGAAKTVPITGRGDIVVLDILGYNNAVEWRGRRIGVGLRQRMTHALNAAYMSGSTSLEQALPDVYANRQALQQELLSLVDRWARTLRARQGVAVPTSMDGSVGNDGVVALLPLGMGEQVATELVACARESQFDCVAVTAEDCDPTDMELMAQAEVCLAARKLAAVLTEPVAAICHLPCGDCTSLLLCTEGPEGYRRKQIEAVSRCGLG